MKLTERGEGGGVLYLRAIMTIFDLSRLVGSDLHYASSFCLKCAMNPYLKLLLGKSTVIQILRTHCTISLELAEILHLFYSEASERGADLSKGCFIGLRVIFDGDLGSHTPHGMYPSSVASLDEQQTVGKHARLSHRHNTPAQC